MYTHPLSRTIHMWRSHGLGAITHRFIMKFIVLRWWNHLRRLGGCLTACASISLNFPIGWWIYMDVVCTGFCGRVVYKSHLLLELFRGQDCGAAGSTITKGCGRVVVRESGLVFIITHEFQYPAAALAFLHESPLPHPFARRQYYPGSTPPN